jgi:DNA-binding Lrp family transcriptional regulator
VGAISSSAGHTLGGAVQHLLLMRVQRPAAVDPRALGFEVQVFAMVGLVSQAEADLIAFEERARSSAIVRDCYMLSGEIDFLLRCVAPDLSAFQISSSMN